MRKNADVQPTFTAHVLLRRDTASFDRLGFNPTALQGLQPKVAKDDFVTTGRITFYTTSLALSVLYPLRHQRHRIRLLKIVLG